jgi:predicted metal-dependent peptidase
VDPRTQKRQLEEAIFIEPTVRTDAEFVFSEAKRKLALKRTVMSSIAVGLCHVAFTRTQETMAVTLTGDGNPLLMINPDFIIDIGPEGAVFVLCHEVYHLLLCHLRPNVGHKTDPVWVLAQESWCRSTSPRSGRWPPPR